MSFKQNFYPEGQGTFETKFIFNNIKYGVTKGRKYMYLKNYNTGNVKQVKLTVTLIDLYITALSSENPKIQEQLVSTINVMYKEELQNKLNSQYVNYIK